MTSFNDTSCSSDDTSSSSKIGNSNEDGVEGDVMFPALVDAVTVLMRVAPTDSTTTAASSASSLRWSLDLLKQAVQQFGSSMLRTYVMLRRITYWFALQLRIEQRVNDRLTTTPDGVSSSAFQRSDNDTGKILAELMVWHQRTDADTT